MDKGSRKSRRMSRHHKLSKAAPLNLVSLMDIFTILVFFLLVNSSSTPQLPNAKDLALPTSTAKKIPKDNLVLAITPKSLLIQGQEVITIDELLNIETDIIEALSAELKFQTENKRTNTKPSLETQEISEGENKGHAITIMGDENITYEILHKILATCQLANYTEIAFAAHQKAKKATQ